MKRAVVFVSLLLVVACKDKSPTGTSGPKTDDALPGTDGMDLAPSAMATKAPTAAGYPNHVFAYSATRGLTLDGRAILAPASSPAQGFDLKDKRNGQGDLFLVPLEDVLTKNAGDTALVALEASTPYRIVAEIAFTLGQGGATSLEFLVRSPAGERRSFTMPLPKTALPCGGTLEDLQRETRTPLCLAVDVASDGLSLRSRRDPFDASCSDIVTDAGATLPTLPAASSKLPLGAASICANTIKKRFPQAVGSRVTVRASGETPWRDVVAVIDTFGPPSGFGDPILAAPK